VRDLPLKALKAKHARGVKAGGAWDGLKAGVKQAVEEAEIKTVILRAASLL
jgi:hypothetical protein